MYIGNLVQRLNEGPAVLFLGQSYLEALNGEDLLLAAIVKKFFPEKLDNKDLSYSDIFISDGGNIDTDNYTSWIHNKSQKIPIADSIEPLAKYPWNSVYTSSIDNIWFDYFRSEWRNLTQIFDPEDNPLDKRSPTNLHCTYLFGSIVRPENQYRPPN